MVVLNFIEEHRHTLGPEDVRGLIAAARSVRQATNPEGIAKF